ncbi:MAG TPA: DMT family protein [Polyangia bacterium]|nr:DMT family protein [Polyangia bacterium]
MQLSFDDRWKAALLLLASNTFMTIAWYGHLRFKKAPLIVAVLASWGIAFFEYTLQVPANRIGYRALSAYQLKVLQEAVTLVVFMIFAALWLGEGLQPRYLVSFGLILAAVVVAFR